MKTLLITGGCGFIGSNFIKYILRKNINWKVINLDKLTYAGNIKNLKNVSSNNRYKFIHGDICDNNLVECIFEQNEIDCVVNFAAESHVDRSIISPEIFIETNVLGTVTLLNTAKKYWEDETGFKKGKKFIQISTDEVYGSLGKTGYFTENTPLDPHSPYSSSKASADLIVKSYFDTYRMPINITRCSNNYGPYQFPEKLIPLIINNAVNKKPLPVYGDGTNIRDWLHVEDHCNAIELVIKNAKEGEIYNIGGNNEWKNINIVKFILRYIQDNIDSFACDTLITFVEDRKGHDKRYAIDSSKIKEKLGWGSTISFEKGIISTIKWYLDNESWIKEIVSGEYVNYYKKMYNNRKILGGREYVQN